MTRAVTVFKAGVQGCVLAATTPSFIHSLSSFQHPPQSPFWFFKHLYNFPFKRSSFS